MIKKNLTAIQQTIADICNQCGRDPKDIRLIAITKNFPEETILEAYSAGMRDFGENKVQELVPKMKNLPDDITWHMVGTVQTNKIRHMAGRADWIHSISKTKQLKELDKRAASAGRKIRVLVQVNISEEDQKSGCEPDEIAGLLSYASGLNHVGVHGLMGMASLTADRGMIRNQFQMLRRLRDGHRSHESKNIMLDELSMGMSGDFDIAIEEGATMIRIGSAIFGSRYS